DLSPVEVTRAILDRLEAVEPALNAFVTVTAELALEQAAIAERAFADGGEPSLLAGIPFSLKDLTATRGIRTARGSLLYADWIPEEDAPVAERMLAAGGVLLGKTNTPELGWKGDSGNRVAGPTHNPWRHGRTAGGSSGGAAAAVSAGIGALAQGTDGAGSIRIPSGFTGTFGHKPSWGLVPQYPASVVPLLSHVGPITRTVRDAALFLDATVGQHALDSFSLPTSPGLLDAMEGDIRGLRIAWSPDLGYAAVDPGVVRIAESAARRFEELGCHVEEAHPPLADPWETVHKVWSCGFAGAFRDQLAEVRDQMDPGLVRVIEAGLGFSAADLAAAYMQRDAYFHGWRQFMADYDLMLTPTLPVTAFEAGQDYPGQIAGRDTTYLSWTAFTYPFNLTGQPAASVPCGFCDGLPVGLQLVGRWRDDATVLRAAAAYEDLAPWTGTKPPCTAPISDEGPPV
ncbi:MAG: amidase, partial [Gemmatimonadetes bacterium]|nr:amidase [Gemmatimonadota bacterium]